MANYPPPPPYGPPFNTNGHIAPPVAAYNPGMPQHPYQQHGQAPYYYGQSQPNGQPPTPHMNSYSYHVNGQGTPPIPGHPVNHTNFVGYGNQVYHSAIPPPPYPPAQIPSVVPSYVPHPAPHFPTISNSASHSTPLTPTPIDAQEVVKPQQTDVESLNHPTPHASELEDGEVNDGESDTLAHSPDADKMGSSFSRDLQSARKDNADPSTAASGSSNLSGSQQEDPPINQVSRVAPAEQRYSSSPYPHQASNQNSTAHTSRVVTSEQISGEDVKMDTSQDGALKESEDTNVLLKAKWEEAKQALRDLHLQGFNFSKIVERGLNPAMLRKLYADVGIPITQDIPMLGSSLTEPRVVSGHTPGLPFPDKLPTNNVDQQPVPVLHVKEDVSPTSKKSITTTKEEKVPSTGSASISKLIKPSVTNQSGKVTGIKAGDSKGVDRKEYIARLAAAKASVSSKAASTPTFESPIQVIVPHTPPTSTTNQSHQEPITDRAQDPEVEAKRKAQTDLARQKIEALKRRETIQQESQTPKSHEGDHHQNQGSLAGPQQASSFTGPATVLQSSIPSRQGSYFSPVTQKPPFSIPGLFMTSDTSQSIPQPIASQAVATAQQGHVYTALGPQPPYLISQGSGEQSKSSMASQAPSIPSLTAITGASTAPAINPTPPALSRKRQKAADFIDSPSTRIKRPLGQQEDSSVIIDISEDDLSNVSDDDDLNMEQAEYPLALSKKSINGQTGSGKQKSIGDLPPLSDLPSRKKSMVMTPPAPQTPGQTKGPKQLKSKEMEIELMRRKIAELEQRNHAKRNTSRAQSPGTSSQVPVSSPLREQLQSTNDPTKALAGVVKAKADTEGLDSTRQSSSTSTEAIESATEERLIAEQHLSEVELARAEAEHSVAVDTVLASEQDRQLQEEALQASRREEGVSRAREPARDQDSNGQDVEHIRSKSIEQQGSQGLIEVAQEIETSEVGTKDERVLRQQGERLQLQEANQRRQKAEQQRLLDEQQRLRKAEIEAGLPILDATVERTKQRIESLRKEMMELEKEIQKGVEGRKSLMEELHDLSQAVGTPQSVVDQIGKPPSSLPVEIQQVSEKEEEKVLSKSVPYNGNSYEPSLRPDAEAITTGQENSTASAEVAAEELSEGELEEDVMDISRSDADEGEISDHSPEQMVVDGDKQSPVDDEESYEPSSDIITTRQPEPDVDTAQPELKGRRADNYALDVVSDMRMDDTSAKTTTEEPNSSEDFASSGITQDEEESQYPNFSMADDSDPDDYEPPEPASLGENSALQPISANSSHASFSAPGFDQDITEVDRNSEPLAGLHDHLTLSDTAARTDPQEQTAQETNHQVGHFVPYESPLKQFKSYRYHPEYLKEVSQGFRSLTYSHAINPEIPICRYELGGVCNDNSCQSQHFRSVALNDDKILLELGARPEGLSPQEQENYTTGLRNIIQDIRNRRIKDLNTVASEITAYRTKFIGDNTKILPL